jgi:hypothetical protein
VRNQVVSALSLLMLVGGVALADKVLDSDWKTGTLVDVTSHTGRRTVGSMSGGQGQMNSLRDDATYYEIDAGDLVYVAKRTLTRRGDKQLKLTVNTPVKFAIKKDDFYILDEEGKEHKLSIEKKTLKTKQ